MSRNYTKNTRPWITDIFPRKGPIAGIHAALMNTSRTEIFVLSCDMPFVNTDVINYMMERAADYDSVVPVIGGRLQPTAAVYNQSCVPLLTDCLKKDKLKLTRIFDDLNALYLDETDLARFGPVAEVFFNINDLAALDKARNRREELAIGPGAKTSISDKLPRQDGPGKNGFDDVYLLHHAVPELDLTASI